MDEIKNQISDIAFSIKENEKIKNSEYFDILQAANFSLVLLI